MTETTRDPELAEAENIEEVRAALNLMCASTTPKQKELPERGTWSTKLDFILSVVDTFISVFLIKKKKRYEADTTEICTKYL